MKRNPRMKWSFFLFCTTTDSISRNFRIAVQYFISGNRYINRSFTMVLYDCFT